MPQNFVPGFGSPDVFYFSGASITANVDGIPFAISRLAASQAVDRKDVRLHGTDIAGRTRGMVSRSGSMEMIKEWADRLIDKLNATYGDWMDGSFNVTIVLAEEKNPLRKKVSKVELIGVYLNKIDEEFNVETSDPVKTKFEIAVNQILINGVSASGSKGIEAVSI
jgi:hypothetical protein